ncbi:MAG: hypothetical protein IJZ22_04680 [Bacteroidaceae bacterium]|nr:hypothetical protein [Bacteroidaceae bacterium]
MLTLNQDYETDIRFRVSVKGVPDDVNIDSQDRDVMVRVRDRGTTLMNYKLESFIPLSVNYSEFVNRKGRLLLPASALQKRVKKQLQSLTSVLAIHPDTLIYYTQESAQRFPIVFNGEVTPARQYAVGDILLSPDSAWVFAPLQVADSIKCIYTQQCVRKELRDTLVLTLPLEVPGSVNSCTPSEVTVTVPVYPYAQKVFRLPVRELDFPDTYKLRTFPSQVQVMLNVSMDKYNTVSADEFEVGVSYLDVFESESNTVAVKLLRSPDYATDVVLVPSEVEYIIEKQ